MHLSGLVEKYLRSGEAVPYAALSLICFSRPYDRVGWYENLDHWAKKFAFEYKWRTLKRSPVMVGCHNIELYAIPPSQRPTFHVLVPDWWVEWESPKRMFVPTTPVFAYLSGVLLSGGTVFGPVLRDLVLVRGTVRSCGADLCFLSAKCARWIVGAMEVRPTYAPLSPCGSFVSHSARGVQVCRRSGILGRDAGQ